MNIELAIQALTEAVKENTAALREILSVGASTAAVQAVPANKNFKRAEQALALQEKLGEMKNAQTREKKAQVAPEPEKEETLEESIEKFHQEVNDAPSDLDIEPAPEDTGDTVELAVPDLPPTELRAKLKEEIKLRIMGDPAFKSHFESCREKYGIALVKDLTDDQLPGFYAEVLA